MSNHVIATKDEIFLLLKQAFSAGVFSYSDLEEIECQKILNQFLESKLNTEDVTEVTLKFGKKSNTSFADIVSGNYFYNYTTSWNSSSQ